MAERKVAFVTGCSEGGIGFSFCEKLLGRGYIVYATARSVEGMKALQHPDVKKLALDVTNDKQVDQVVQTIIEDEGHIDIVINNAGVLAPGPIVECTTDQVKAVYDANVFSIVRVSRAVVPHMAKRKQGLIVNMGSIVGEFPTPWTGIYDSSKAAVRIMTEVLALECRPFNIHVMLVAPGTIQSKIIDKQDDYHLSPNTIYSAFFHNIRQRLEVARASDAMPTDSFTELVISKAVSSNPPSQILTGGKSWIFRIMAYLPRSWILSIVWNMFSKPETKKRS